MRFHLTLVWLLSVIPVTAASPWWSQRWTHRQSVEVSGPWARIPFDEEMVKGRFVDPQAPTELPHWTQTIGSSDPRSIAVDPQVHYGFPRLIRAKDGRLLLFYRVGVSHAKDPAAIAQRASFDQGRSWSDERIIHRDPDGHSAHNPVAVTAADGRVLLFVSSYNFRDRRKLPMYWAHSDDHGETWSAFTHFDPDPSRSTYYMTDIERTDAGLFGMSAGFAPDARSQCHNILWYSPDGREWKLRSFQTQPPENRGDEVDIFPVAADRFMIFHRDRRRQTTWRVRTEDAGRTWNEREDLGDQVEILQRPFVTRLTGKIVLLSGRDAKRKLVVVYVSRDGGENFGERHVIDSYSADGAYTSAVRLNDRQAVLVYYCDRPASRGKPDIHQVTLTVRDRPTHVCIQSSTNGPAHFYSRPDTTRTTEDRTFAWLSPPGGWTTAKLLPTKTPRGTIPLLRQRTWTGSFPPLEDWQVIKNELDRAWQISKKIDPDQISGSELPRWLRLDCQLHLARFQLDEADRYAVELLAWAEKSANDDGIASGFFYRGRIAQAQRDFAEAEQWYLKSLAISEKQGNEHGAAITSHQLGVIAQEQRDSAEAEQWYLKSLAIKEKQGNEHGAAGTYHQMGIIAQEQRDFAGAEQWDLKSLAISEKQGNEHGVAITYHQWGMIAQELRDFAGAEQRYLKSLAIKEKQGNECGAASTYHQLGMIAQKQHDFLEAEKWYLKSLANSEKRGNEHGVARTYHQLGMIAQGQRDFLKAEKWYLKSLTISEKQGKVDGAASTYHQLGRIAEKQRDFAGAGKFGLKAVAIFAKAGDDHSLGVAARSLAGVLSDCPAEIGNELRKEIVEVLGAEGMKQIEDLVEKIRKSDQ